MCGKIISAQGLVIDHLKNIHVGLSTRLYVVWKHLVVPQPNIRTHNICPWFALPTQWQKVELQIVP